MYLGSVTPQITLFNASLVLAAGIMLGLVAFISAIYQGIVCAASVDAIGNGHDILGQGLVLGALPEFYAILSLVSAILIKIIKGF